MMAKGRKRQYAVGATAPGKIEILLSVGLSHAYGVLI